MSEERGKIVFRIYEGIHLWGNDKVFPKGLDLETVLDLAKAALQRGEGHPVVMEADRPAVNPEKIHCEHCRASVERQG